MEKEILKATDARSVMGTQGFEFLKNQIAKAIKCAAREGDEEFNWRFSDCVNREVVNKLLSFYRELGYCVINCGDTAIFNWSEREEHAHCLDINKVRADSLNFSFYAFENMIIEEIKRSVNLGKIKVDIDIRDYDEDRMEFLAGEYRDAGYGVEIDYESQIMSISWRQLPKEIIVDMKEK